MSKEQIASFKKRIRPILKKAGVIRSHVFGSYARGESKRKSDVDILVEFNPKMKVGLLGLIGLKHDLEDNFGKKFDVLTYKGIHPYVRENVEKDMISIL